MKNKFSLDKPSKIKKLICELLEEIKFFDCTNASILGALEQVL